MGYVHTPTPESATQAAEAAETAVDTRGALQAVKGEIEPRAALNHLADAMKATGADRWKQLGGLAAMLALGWILKEPEDMEYFAKGQEKIDPQATLANTAVEQAYAMARVEAELKVQAGTMSPDEARKNFNPERDKSVTAMQSATNMYAIRYYSLDGKGRHPKPNGLAKICMRENTIPSKFILEKSTKLFEKGVGSFDDFKKTVDKLVDSTVTDPAERLRQAPVILSCCAIGHFQIIPEFNFKAMGWPTRGEEGLRAMYDFITTTDKQIAMYKKILTGSWSRYHDAGLLAVAYYAGDGVAEAYRRDPSNPKWSTGQYAGHASIEGYAARARANFSKFKAQFPGQSDLDIVAMVIESNETGGSVIAQRVKSGQTLSADA